MTVQEAREETKEIEGRPAHPAADSPDSAPDGDAAHDAAVPEADVVVTNLTHFAVALRQREMEVPVVTAKGPAPRGRIRALVRA